MRHIFKHIIVTLMTIEARLLLMRVKPTVIAITGSVGKTSTKDAIYEVLRRTVHARKSEKSFNSELGIPLTVLGLPNGWSNPLMWLKNIVDGFLLVIHPGDYPKVLILEVGVDRPGDMDRVTKWIRPDIVVLTRLPDIPVHVEFFDSPDAVVAEKLKLVDALKPSGILVYNQDDAKVEASARAIFQKSIGYSRYSQSHFRATDDEIVYEHGTAIGCAFTIHHIDTSTRFFIRGSVGVQHAYTISAAVAVGSLFGVSLSDAQTALGEYIPQAGRMRLIPGIKQTLIIDDTYNSSPIASEYALQTLRELKGVKRRIAVLGDMLELGAYSIQEHERIGRIVASSTDLLMTIGVRARGFATGALDAGMNEKKILQFEDPVRAGRELQNLIKPGDILLIKGSQSIRAERVVLEIMAEPERAEELLVRQSEAWLNIE